MNTSSKRLFLKDAIVVAKNINGYLFDGPNIYAQKRNSPICEVPKMIKGSQPTDGGNLLFTEDERADFLKDFPKFSPYVKRYMGSDDLINGKLRYCLWLKECPPNLMRSSPEVLRRLNAVKDSRLASKKAVTRKWAEVPALFTEDRQPDSNYLMIPVVSSERRRYVPMDYVTKDVIANTNVLMIPNATAYHFGILTSSIHMAWMRTVCGRMKSDYAYSATIVYNNFIWANPTAAQRRVIELTAQKILDVRKKYMKITRSEDQKITSKSSTAYDLMNLSSCDLSGGNAATLADLYDPLTMPADLRAAHRANDKAVASAYGFEAILDDEPAIVAELFKLYAAMTGADSSEN